MRRRPLGARIHTAKLEQSALGGHTPIQPTASDGNAGGTAAAVAVGDPT
jgi:hypothetical protein